LETLEVSSYSWCLQSS